MQKFKVNDYITLKLEEEAINIYVNGELFNQCMSILFRMPTMSLEYTEEIESIDDVVEILGWTIEGQNIVFGQNSLTPEEEFQGHCSNLQVWYEHNYDSRLLHSNLSFPLLKKLSEVGDPIALKVFKEEIAKRFKLGNKTVIFYLLEEKYLEFLDTEELNYIIENSTLVETIFKNRDLEYDDFHTYFTFLQQKAPMGLANKFFNEKKSLKPWVINLLENPEITPVYILEMLYLLFVNVSVFKEPLFKGLADIFSKGSFSLIYNLLSFLKEFEFLEQILEKILHSKFFTEYTPLVQSILENLKEDDFYAKRRSMITLQIIWRYLDNGLNKMLIKRILEDKKNRNKLLLEIITVWYDRTTVLNYDSIHELRGLGDDALQDLKIVLKGRTDSKSKYLTYRRGKLDELSFRSDLESDYYDFNYTIELIHSLFGGRELIRYLEGFDGVGDLILINKSNYPGPLDILAEAFIECSELNDGNLIDKVYKIYQSFDKWEQNQIIQYFLYGQSIFDRKEIITYCFTNNLFEGIRFFLNFNVLSQKDIQWLKNIPEINFVEKVIESQKELKYPSEKYDLFLEEMVYDNPHQFTKSIHLLDAQNQKEFVIYLSDLMSSFRRQDIFTISFISFLEKSESENMDKIQHQIGKIFRVLGNEPYMEVGFSYDDGKVIELRIERCSLQTLPKEIIYLTSLRKLKLRDNLLNSLPESLVNLQNLEFLDVSNNPELSNISHVITKLKNLTRIII